MTTWHHRLIAIVLCSLLASCATHTRPQRDLDYAAGQQLYQQQDYHAAYNRLLMAAQRGHPGAQYAVGYMLYHGVGVSQNQSLALHWLQRSAKQGNVRAEQALQRLDAQQTTLLGAPRQP